MKLAEYREKVRVTRGSGYNSYIVTIHYRGREYKCQSNNSLAWDRLMDAQYVPYYVKECCGMTEKEAFEAFYYECKCKNGLR